MKQSFKSVSLADQVFDRLENDIIQGIYPKGEILTELRLVEQLGVSRTPIREALRRLEQEHLIEDAGKGSRVLGISEEDVLDIMNIREHTEALASFHATQNMTPEGLEELRHIVDLMEFYFSRGDIEHLRRTDDDFHEAICRLSQRAVIKDTLVPLHRKTRRYRKIAMENNTRATCTLQEHNDIFKAIENKDAVLASQLTAKHIANARRHMFGV